MLPSSHTVRVQLILVFRLEKNVHQKNKNQISKNKLFSVLKKAITNNIMQSTVQLESYEVQSSKA